MNLKIQRIAIIGSALGGGAAQIIDALVGTSNTATAIFDASEAARGQSILGTPVLGDSDIDTIRDHHARGIFDAAVIAIGGDLRERERVFHALRATGIALANVIDPAAQLRSGVKLGVGNVVLAGVFLGPHVEIGDNCYIITHTSIQHDSRVGSHAYFSPAVALGGRVEVGNRVRFELRSAARSGVKIGDDCVIAAGAIVSRDLAPGSRFDASERGIG